MFNPNRRVHFSHVLLHSATEAANSLSEQIPASVTVLASLLLLLWSELSACNSILLRVFGWQQAFASLPEIRLQGWLL